MSGTAARARARRRNINRALCRAAGEICTSTPAPLDDSTANQSAPRDDSPPPGNVSVTGPNFVSNR